MRVIAGKFRSRALHSAPGNSLRPTADRLRETLFNVLTAGNPTALEGTIWIDLYAGTGAVGIEAISRGAQTVYFVDAAAPAADLIRRNLRSLGIGTGFEVIKENAARALNALQARSIAVDFVFLDPPYELAEEYQKTLENLSKSSLWKPESIVIAEHLKKADPGEAFGSLGRYRRLEQGDAALSFYRKKSTPSHSIVA
ncbi:MAG: 16S rRNA (guanine(966)-N(2))-methyltransferase RsmD [Terriglobales bacterium]